MTEYIVRAQLVQALDTKGEYHHRWTSQLLPANPDPVQLKMLLADGMVEEVQELKAEEAEEPAVEGDAA